MSHSLKVLVVRFSSIGDIVLTSPIVRVLKKQKNAQIHFLTKSQYLSILVNNLYIDKVIIINKYFTVEGKINALIEIIESLKISPDSCSKEHLSTLNKILKNWELLF